MGKEDRRQSPRMFRREIMSLDRQIRDYRRRNMSFSSLEMIEAMARKNDAFIDVLRRRRAGEEGIAVHIVGNKEEGLHSYSGNNIVVLLHDSTSELPWYESRTNLRALRLRYTGNLALFIGEPNAWITEKPGERLMRLFAEVNEIDAILGRILDASHGKISLLFEIDEMNNLKVHVIRQIFATPKQEVAASGDFSVEQIREDGLLLVRFVPGQGREMGFKLPQELASRVLTH